MGVRTVFQGRFYTPWHGSYDRHSSMCLAFSPTHGHQSGSVAIGAALSRRGEYVAGGQMECFDALYPY